MSILAELRVPPDASYVSLIATLVGDTAARAALDLRQTEAIAAAASSAFELIVRDAMAEAHEAVHVTARSTPEQYCLVFLEHGLPMDDALVRNDPQWHAIVDRVDTAHWKLRGKAGSELTLSVARPHGIAHDNEQPPPEETVPLAPQQNYTIRRFVPDDAAGVARAFYLTWGYHYVNAAVFVPERLVALNKSNEFISIVAVAEDGEIVGHYALDPVPGSPIADACSAVVVPAHRSRGLLERLRLAAEDEAKNLSLAAYYSEPVTTHGRTQQESAKVGAQLCAIVLAGDPPSFVPKHMTVTGKGQRQSFTLYMKPLSQRETRTIYAPPQHRDIIAKIYSNLDLPVAFETAAASTGASEIDVQVVRAEQYATIDVLAAGATTAHELRQAVADLKRLAHVGAIYVNLPLEQPETPELCEALEESGFIFCGVIPWLMRGHDVLRLQCTLSPIDLDGVTIIGDFGIELKNYIAAQKGSAAAVPQSR